MWRVGQIIISVIVAITIFIVLGKFEIKSISSVFFRTMWSNFNSISTIIYVLIPLILLMILLLLFITNRWALHVEKLSVGGFNIIFDNPAKLYKRQIKNYLDTKRTIFRMDFEHDNFYETFDSYFEIYKFFRDETKTLGNIKKESIRFNRKKEATHLYDLTNEAIQTLNIFLTKNQSNYRRWYKYIEKTKEEDFYLKPIGELQKDYPMYKELCSDFEEVNLFFVNIISIEFDINIEKWGIKPTYTDM